MSTPAPSPVAAAQRHLRAARWRRVGYVAVYVLLAAMSVWLLNDFARERERTLEQTTQVARQQSDLMARGLGETFLSADYVVRDILTHVAPALVAGRADAGSMASVAELLRRKADTAEGVFDVAVFDARCVLLASARGQFIGYHSQQKACATAADHPAHDDLHVEYFDAEHSASQRPVLVMARLAHRDDGALAGGVLAVIDMEQPKRWLATLRPGPGDAISLMDTQGHLLARNPALPEQEGRRLDPAPGMPAFDRFSGTVSGEVVSPLDARKRIYSMTRLPRLPLVVMSALDEDRALAQWRARTGQFGTGFVALLLLSSLILLDHRVTRRQRDMLRQLATTDALTGVPNRRHLMELGQTELGRAARYGRPVSVLMVDIDHFKHINDRHGHAVGDQALKAVAQQLRAALRDHDSVGRLGGEEFAVLLPETDAAGAHTLAERLRAAVQGIAHVIPAPGAAALPLTVSIGAATLGGGGAAAQSSDQRFEDLLHRADAAMYRAKKAGRNRVATAAPEGTRPAPLGAAER